MSRQVILYTRHNCGLCEEAAADLRQIQRDLGFTLLEHDIDADAALRGQYDDRVPVIVIDGRVIAESPIQPAMLREQLAAALA